MVTFYALIVAEHHIVPQALKHEHSYYIHRSTFSSQTAHLSLLRRMKRQLFRFDRRFHSYRLIEASILVPIRDLETFSITFCSRCLGKMKNSGPHSHTKVGRSDSIIQVASWAGKFYFYRK